MHTNNDGENGMRSITRGRRLNLIEFFPKLRLASNEVKFGGLPLTSGSVIDHL